MTDSTSSSAPAAPVRRGLRPLTVGLLIVLAVAGWWWWHHHQTAEATVVAPGAGGRMRGGGGGGPVTVTAATAKPADLRIERTALGTVTSLNTVTIRTQLSGRLEHLAFTEGQMVAAGDLLAQIDDRPFALALTQYQGQLTRDEAQLHQAEQDLVRYQTLVDQDSLAHQQLDTQQSLVNQIRGTVASDQAQIDTTKLNLAYCRITAPCAGQLGLRAVDAGNYVTPGDANGIVTITQLTPISVLFALPEVDLPLILPEVRDGHALTVQILDRDGVRELGVGTLTTVDNAIDATTGTLRMRATLANDDRRLFPNQFVNVRLLVQTRHADTVIPVAAVQRNSKGTYVWTVTDGTTQMKPVKVGLESHDLVEVRDGLAAGDQVVIDGVDRLRDGATVVVSAGEPASGVPTDGAAGKPHEHRKHRDGETGGDHTHTAADAGTANDAIPAPPAAKP